MQFFGVAYQECRAIKKSHNHFMLSSQHKHFNKMQPFFSLLNSPTHCLTSSSFSIELLQENFSIWLCYPPNPFSFAIKNKA
jgi:hypothetical protein